MASSIEETIVSSLAAIVDKKGFLIGTGFVAGNGLVVTTGSNIKEEPVLLRFGIDPRLFISTISQIHAEPGEAIAVLKLERNFPEEISPVSFGPSSNSQGREFASTGFHGIGSAYRLAQITGMIEQQAGMSQYLQMVYSGSGHAHEGAPVWDRQTGLVIGMVMGVSPDNDSKEMQTTGVAVVITSERILEICPELNFVPQMNISEQNDDSEPDEPDDFEANQTFSNNIGPVKSAAQKKTPTRKRRPTPAQAKPRPAQRTLLAVQGGTRIELLYNGDPIEVNPWQLDVDACVLPVGARAGLYGQSARAFLDMLGAASADTFRSRLTEGLKSRQPPVIEPRTPLLVDIAGLSPEARPRAVIAATAYRGASQASAAQASQTAQDNAPSEGLPSVGYAGDAAEEIIRLASENKLERIAVSLLGTGMGKLPSLDVAREMLAAILDRVDFTRQAPGSLPLKQIILLTGDWDTFESLRSQIHRQPQKSFNDEARGEDRLAIRGEMDALAETLLLRETQPPLAVGIVGGWGSGKSFAMHLLRRRMAEIRAMSTVGDYPYAGHVYLIDFDAWTFAKSSLWASLMQTIFICLNRQLEREKEFAPGKDANELANVLAIFEEATPVVEGDTLWAEMQARKEDELKELKTKEEDLARRRAELEAARVALEKQIDEQIEAESQLAAWRPLLDTLAKPFGETVRRWLFQAAGLDANLPEHSGLAWRNWIELSAFAAFVLATLFLPWAVKTLGELRFAGAGLAGLFEVLRLLDQWRKQLDQERDKLKNGRAARIEQAISDQKAELHNRTKDLQDQSLQKKNAVARLAVQDNLPALEQQVKDLEIDVEKQRRLAGVSARYASLLDLVTARLKAADYENQLGLMHQVGHDLKELTSALTQGKDLQVMFPRGKARIVLFIDDLDRCPPDRVVEVLEATQLLLKTELFVVVIAMDVRYVTRALEKAYDRILTRQGDPSGLDYIEKIIQIPYQIRPVSGSAVSGYMQSLMTVETTSARGGQLGTGDGRPAGTGRGESGEQPGPTGISGTGDGKTPAGGGQTPDPQQIAAEQARRRKLALPPQAIAFSQPEYDFSVLCCQDIHLTPRAVKRLVNVYKLLKILWYREPQWPQPEWPVEQAMVLLLSLACAYPDAMRSAFDLLIQRTAPAVRSGRFSAPASETLLDFLSSDLDKRLAGLACEEWESAKRDLVHLTDPDAKHADLIEPLRPLKLSQLPTEIIYLVRSFSFVGDIGYEPGDKPAPGEGHPAAIETPDLDGPEKS